MLANVSRVGGEEMYYSNFPLGITDARNAEGMDSLDSTSQREGCLQMRKRHNDHAERGITNRRRREFVNANKV